MQNSVFGQRTGRTYTDRSALFSMVGLRYAQGGMVIDSTYAYDGSNTGYPYELRAGTVMAQITSTDLWVPCKRSAVLVASTSASAASADISVTNAAGFKAGDLITVNSTTATILSVNYTTNVITLTAAIDVDLAVGDPVFGRSTIAGSEIARGILDEHINLLDDDGTVRNKSFSKLIIGGMCRKDKIIGDIAGILLATNKLVDITWAEDAGQI